MPAVLGQLLKFADRVVVLRSVHAMSGGAAPPLGPIPPLHPSVEVVQGEWASESETRNAGMEILSDCDFVFHVDSDEIFSDKALATLVGLCLSGKHRAIAGRFHTYWKTIDWRIDPPEQLIAPMIVRRDVRFDLRRMLKGEMTVVNQAIMHHLSYVRTDDEVREKILLSCHAHEMIPGWFENVWKAWDENHRLENLHPTNPEAYKRAVPADKAGLVAILREHGVPT